MRGRARGHGARLPASPRAPRTRRASLSVNESVSLRSLPQKTQATMPGPTCAPITGDTVLKMMGMSEQPGSLRTWSASHWASFSASEDTMPMGMCVMTPSEPM